MTIRERVARAICLVFEGENRCPFGHEIPPSDEPDMEEGGFSMTGKEIDEWNELTKRAGTAAVNAFLAAAGESGWHMRPDEATEEMSQAGIRASGYPGLVASGPGESGRKQYRAMLAAAPEFERDK